MTSATTDRRMGLVGNIAMKAPVTALAAGNITLSGQQTIDGVAVLAINAAGVADRVLCIGQTNAAQNGIWDVSTAAWTRSLDADGNYDLRQGSTVLVNRGALYASTYWKIFTSDPITIGTTSTVWTRSLASDLSMQSFLQGGTGAVLRGAQDKMREAISAADFLVVANGIADDTINFNLARAAAITAGRALRIVGTPLISSQLFISVREHWLFEGAVGNSDGGLPGSYLIKKSTVLGDFVSIVADGTYIEGGGLLGQVGNTGDGYVIKANGVVLENPYVTKMGNDGIRVGTDAAGTNANSAKLINPVSVANLRHGIYLNDDNTAVSCDANSALLLSPVCLLNGGDGLKADRGWLNTIVNPLCESNTGIGLHFASASLRNCVFGGDVEANTAANIVIDAGATNNQIYGTDSTTAITDNGTGSIIFGRLANKVSIGLALGNTVQPGTTTLDYYKRNGAFTPVLTFGGAAVGMTYGTTYGDYTRVGNLIVAYITVILTAKGASVGNAQISGLPFTAANVAFNSGVIFSQISNMNGLTGMLLGQVASNSAIVNLYQIGATGQASITATEFTNTSNLQMVVIYPV